MNFVGARKSSWQLKQCLATPSGRGVSRIDSLIRFILSWHWTTERDNLFAILIHDIGGVFSRFFLRYCVISYVHTNRGWLISMSLLSAFEVRAARPVSSQLRLGASTLELQPPDRQFPFPLSRLALSSPCSCRKNNHVGPNHNNERRENNHFC